MSRNTKLYCTEVTRSLLMKNPEFLQLVPFLHGLPTDEPISMSLEAYTDCEVECSLYVVSMEVSHMICLGHMTYHMFVF